jgi:hypothetical protein
MNALTEQKFCPEIKANCLGEKCMAYEQESISYNGFVVNGYSTHEKHEQTIFIFDKMLQEKIPHFKYKMAFIGPWYNKRLVKTCEIDETKTEYTYETKYHIIAKLTRKYFHCVKVTSLKEVKVTVEHLEPYWEEQKEYSYNYGSLVSLRQLSPEEQHLVNQPSLGNGEE